MKKFVFVLAALAVAAVACEKPEPEVPDTTPAELLSFKILAADNEGLAADYVAETIEQSMVIRIPGGGQGKTLKATLTAGENDEIKVNDVAVVEGKASFDASFPVDIVVTNTKSKKSAQYEVKIGKILQIVAKEVTTFTSEGMAYTSSAFTVATNPVTKEIYMAYACGSTKNVGVVKFNGATFEQIGVEGISNGEIATTNPFSLAFDASGAPYVLYGGGEVKSRFSIRKFNGSAWELLGSGLSSGNYSTSFYPDIYFDASGNPGWAFCGNQKNTPGYRNANILSYDGSEWKETATMTGLPTYESNNTAMFYLAKYAKVGDKQYGVFTSNQAGLFLYELSGSSWGSPIVSAFVPAEETTSLPGNLSCAASKDGKLLVFTARWTKKAMQVYQFNGTALEEYGNTFPVEISTNGSPNDAAFAVNPVTGELYAVVLSESGQIMYTIMDENLQWGELNYLGSVNKVPAPTEGDPDAFTYEYGAPGAYGGPALAFDEKGNAIVIYPDADRKSGYHVYSIGLEDDILPE